MVGTQKMHTQGKTRSKTGKDPHAAYPLINLGDCPLAKGIADRFG
jgi:hypothetical protein